MKILLANPSCKTDIGHGFEKYFIRAGSRWPHSAVKKKGVKPYYLPFPFYLAYTASLLRENNYDVQVLDAVALDWSEQFFLRRVYELNPDIILFETTTPTINSDLELTMKIKEKILSYIIFAGAHVTTFPTQIIEENSQVDFVMLGEYEFAFLELVKCLENKGKIDELKGIGYRANNHAVVTNRFPEIDPLDKLPYPAYDLFPSNQEPNIYFYWDGISLHGKTIQMHASRGCPYRCNYCLWIQVMYNSGKYRIFSAQRVADEIQYLVSLFGAEEIYFDDDDFTISKKHVLRICDEIKKRKLKIKWSAMGDAVNPDEELIKEMASAGCIAMKFGVESGSPEVLKQLGKPVKLDRVRKVAKWCAEYGIRSHATFTFGLLGEDKHSMKKTLRFAMELNTDTVQFSINTPFPGTRYYDMAVDKGYLESDAWKSFDGECSAVINLANLSARDIQEFHSQAVRKWLMFKLLQPAWLKRQIIYFLNILRYQGVARALDLMKHVFKDVVPY